MKKLYEFSNAKDLSGWLFIRGQLRITCPTCEVYLVIEKENSKGEDEGDIDTKNLIRVPVTKRGVINYVFNIKDRPEGLYLATRDEDCSIEILKGPWIKRLSTLERYYRIYRRVISVFLSKQRITREIRKRVGLKLLEFFLRPYNAYHAITWRRFYDVWGSSNYEDFLRQLEDFYIANKGRILQNLNKLRYKPRFGVFIPLFD